MSVNPSTSPVSNLCRLVADQQTIPEPTTSTKQKGPQAHHTACVRASQDLLSEGEILKHGSQQSRTSDLFLSEDFNGMSPPPFPAPSRCDAAVKAIYCGTLALSGCRGQGSSLSVSLSLRLWRDQCHTSETMGSSVLQSKFIPDVNAGFLRTSGPHPSPES